jgi:hypothetical protein
MGLLSLAARRLGRQGARAAAHERSISLSLADLPDPGAGWVDADKVARYGAMDSAMPPILVARRPGGDWQILDGFHRAAARRRAGLADIEAFDVSDRVRW